MFAMFATFFRALNELFLGLEVAARTIHKGAQVAENLVDKEIAEAKAKADDLSE
jgi:hypothetical protein